MIKNKNLVHLLDNLNKNTDYLCLEFQNNNFCTSYDNKISKNKIQFLKKFKNLINKINYKNSNINIDNYTSKNFNNTNNQKNNNDIINQKNNDTINQKNNIDIKQNYINTDLNLNNQHSIHYSKLFKFINNEKSMFYKYLNITNLIKIIDQESIYTAVCFSIYEKYHMLSDINKKLFMKNLKYKLAVDFNEKSLYIKFNYKKIKKNDLLNKLIHNNTNLGKHFYIYLSDYLNINLILLENNKINYLNTYDNNKLILLLEKIDGYVHLGLDNNNIFLSNKNFKILENKLELNNNNKKKKINLNKLKIIDLQNLCTKYKINIKKQGKTKIINKTKKELINKLNNINIDS